jgi:predicted RNA-binding Zn-ribbon protein involved in translation (DUF1610 family)
MARARRQATTAKTPARSSRRATAKKESAAARPRTVAASPRTPARPTATFKCPECGRTFTRAAALGAHRRQAHGVAGSSANAAIAARSRNATKPNSSRAGAPDGRGKAEASLNRDALLASVFPAGIPAKETVIRAVNSWLDEAERLAQLR